MLNSLATFHGLASAILISFGLLPANGSQHRVSVRQSGPALLAGISGPGGTSGNVQRYILFVGPKELDILKSVGKGLERTIDFGYFGFISIPFLYVLHFFNRFTGSYGIDIILLTVLIKLLMAPLTHKSFVSMKQMQKLQPQMERLKEKFKDDKEKLNKEVMELYRRNGVNPLGGCLPMVLQFPVFIGLYNALSTPIELRHAPFLWIKDLSRPDWGVTAVYVGGLAPRDSRAHDIHGRQHVHSTMDDPECRRSQSEKDDAHDAVDIYLHVRIVSRGSHGLLAGEQHSYHWPAVLDQPHG